MQLPRRDGINSADTSRIFSQDREKQTLMSLLIQAGADIANDFEGVKNNCDEARSIIEDLKKRWTEPPTDAAVIRNLESSKTKLKDFKTKCQNFEAGRNAQKEEAFSIEGD